MPALHSSKLNDLSSLDGVSETPTKHPIYYMSGGNVVIRVQNTLFKLDLSVLHAKSSILRIIMPPVYSGKARLHGFDHNQPFVLHEVTENDFVRLLWVLYPSTHQLCQPITAEDWVSILKLSTRYQIEDVRSQAMARLHALPLDPVRKIAIWKDYHLDSAHLTSSYVALCQRKEPLTLPMTMVLGLKTFTKVAAARDAFHYRIGFGCCKQLDQKDKQRIAEEVVRDVFSRPRIC
ncbi:hypothetical protein BDZ94DRAFT_1265366 [Collybia nuda]|uniref:BTB domain-containing protein n=1 Tax=Collybia nuda TaxID=64659 RepID=A0A9P5XZY2_9AGAR|nr:hypothetical protein BDZ94DRAFT_1265366 [Collybia nuda]